LKTIITTESTDLWQNFAVSLKDRVDVASELSDVENNAGASISLCLQACADFDVLDEKIKQSEVEAVLIFYQQAEHAIAIDLMIGKSLEEAANNWLQKTQKLLQFQKQNRRLVKLLNLEQALANPKPLSQQLERQGVSLLVEFESTTPTSLLLLLACQYVRQDTKLKVVNARLSASSLPLDCGLDIELDNNLLLTELSSSKSNYTRLADELAEKQISLGQLESSILSNTAESADLKSKLSAFEQKSIELNQRLHLSDVETAKLHEINNSLQLAVEDKEQAAFQAKRELERKNIEVVGFKNELELQTANNVKITEDFQREAELFQLQLAQMQEELEQYSLDLMNEKQSRAEKENESTSIINSISAAFESLKQENELLNLQLVQVQEELEKFYLDLMNEKQTRAEKENEFTATIKKTTAAFDSIKQENDLLILQLTQVQEELERNYLLNTSIEKELGVVKTDNLQLVNSKANLESTIKNLQTAEGKLNQKLDVLTTAEKSKSELYAQSLQQLKIKELELAKLNNQYDKAKGEIDILNHRLQQSSGEIEVIKSSMLWKSAEPMRKLARVVQKVDKKRAKLQQDIGLLLTSEYFDAQWYLDTYPDVAASNTNPAEHYLKFGAKEGRFPSPRFDGNWYLKRYPDIAIADINPLIHFIKFGISEGRSASPKMLTNQSNKIRG
jgi:hypothetical protein